MINLSVTINTSRASTEHHYRDICSHEVGTVIENFELMHDVTSMVIIVTPASQDECSR